MGFREMSGKKPGEWTFKTIVEDGSNWERYQRAYGDQVTEEQVEEVEKMLGCGDARQGFATYVCLDCGEEKRVSFSCKSRICSSCGKVHADEWSEQLSSRMWNVTHRHITLTLPSELWLECEANESWRKELFGAADATLKEVMKSQAGVVMTLHPYGKDLKVNYHVHVLVTEGGMDEAGQWQAQPYLDYKSLRRVWQYEVLTRLRAVMPETLENKRLINELFTRYPNGFYVYAKPKVRDSQGIGRYIGRYLRHPAIADSRIVAYDGETVSFCYDERFKGRKVRREQTLPVLDFMHGVIRHIPPKHFKMVRYYGLYAPRKKAAVKQLMKQIGNMLGRAVRRLGWRGRRLRDFHQDPLTCSQCGSTDMVLFSLTLPWMGRMITLGGWPWLFARGDLIEDPPQSLETQHHPESLPYQSAFAFPVAA